MSILLLDASAVLLGYLILVYVLLPRLAGMKAVRRSLRDPAWADEVIRRWDRRRWRVQQRERAVAELKAAFLPPVERAVKAFDQALRRWPALYRWLSR